MKIFLEADFTKGNGALRWEGITSRRLSKVLISVLTIIAAATLILIPRM